jgi:hypothetical protein
MALSLRSLTHSLTHSNNTHLLNFLSVLFIVKTVLNNQGRKYVLEYSDRLSARHVFLAGTGTYSGRQIEPTIRYELHLVGV